MSRILVTGGHGFLGAHVVSMLTPEHEVMILDRGSSASGVGSLAVDLTDMTSVHDVFASHAFDVVVNLAGLPDARYCENNPAEAYAVNTQGVSFLLSAMRYYGVTRFIQASTIMVYGKPQHIPVSESAPLLGVGVYAQSKIQAESLIQDEVKDGLHAFTLRFTNMVGPRLDGSVPGGVVPAMLKAAHSGADFPLCREYPTRDGSMIRDFLDITDGARAVAASVQRLLHGSPGGVLNISSDVGVSFLELGQMIEEVTSSPVPYTLGLLDSSQPPHLVFNNALSFRSLPWYPSVTLPDTLQRLHAVM